MRWKTERTTTAWQRRSVGQMLFGTRDEGYKEGLFSTTRKEEKRTEKSTKAREDGRSDAEVRSVSCGSERILHRVL